MMKIDEETIRALAPNPAALTNGRGLTGDFIARKRDKDGVCYWGLCQGSGKAPYAVSAEIREGEKPVLRCSCPSRQYPCKHALGLLFCIARGMEFEEAEIPEDLAKKREKKKAAAPREKSDRPPKTNTAALVKKMRQQIEGLAKVEGMLDDALKLGFASCSPKQIAQWRQMAKELESSYLTGPQTEVKRLLAVLASEEEDGEKYARAAYLSGRLHALCKRGTELLERKCASDDPDYEASEIYELLGVNWKLEQLDRLGLTQRGASLVQLAFVSVKDDEAAEYADIGFWAELTGGTIEQTKTYVPFKAAKYVRHDDTDTTRKTVEKLYRYPGGRRVRWEEAESEPVRAEDLARVFSLAVPAPEAVKRAKDRLKAPLAEAWEPALVAYKQVLRAESGYQLECGDGVLVTLSDYAPFGASCDALGAIGEPRFLADQAAFGVFHFTDGGALRFMPLSLVAKDALLRLQF